MDVPSLAPPAGLEPPPPRDAVDSPDTISSRNLRELARDARPDAGLERFEPFTLEDSLMPLEVNRLNSYRRPLTVGLLVDEQPETVNLIYLPIKMLTPRTMAATRLARGDAFRSIELLASVLADSVVEWDVTQDGQPYPPTQQNLEPLGADFLGAIVSAIDGDLPAAMQDMTVTQRVLPPASDEATTPTALVSTNGTGNRAQRRAAAKDDAD